MNSIIIGIGYLITIWVIGDNFKKCIDEILWNFEGMSRSRKVILLSMQVCAVINIMCIMADKLSGK